MNHKRSLLVDVRPKVVCLIPRTRYLKQTIKINEIKTKQKNPIKVTWGQIYFIDLKKHFKGDLLDTMPTSFSEGSWANRGQATPCPKDGKLPSYTWRHGKETGKLPHCFPWKDLKFYIKKRTSEHDKHGTLQQHSHADVRTCWKAAYH